MKKKRPSKTFSPLGNSTVEICKNLLVFRAELTRSPDELKTTANEILRVLAKDVLLSQVHQGRPIESADIGAFDCFYAAQEKPPHIYLTLIQVSGWASPVSITAAASRTHKSIAVRDADAAEMVWTAKARPTPTAALA